jgi:hypothetical protein
LTKNLSKHVRLILNEGLDVSALEGIGHLVQKTLDQGWVETDYFSIYDAVNPPAPRNLIRKKPESFWRVTKTLYHDFLFGPGHHVLSLLERFFVLILRHRFAEAGIP